jgi:pyridoxal phosphate enzyme (YggS family)
MRQERSEQLARGLARTRERIARACVDAARDPAQVHLVVITKTFPASDVIALARLGVTDVGENRHQEAAPKFAEVVAAGITVVRHMVGQIQTNKAAALAEYADVIHAVDRPKLVRALDAGLVKHHRTARALIQVSLDDAPGRGGADPAAVCDLADEVASTTALTLAGVMAVAPLGADPDVAFGRLAEIAAQVRSSHPHAWWVSAGMSGDLEAAVRHGATHLRVGTAILGTRPPLL